MTQPSCGVYPSRFSRGLARLVLLTFVLTFITSRITVFLIMARRIPDFYVHLGGTHVHHLNYGIFLLSAVGAYLLFAPLSPRRLSGAAVCYGIGLALTFDEFGMWLHLSDAYWQRASFDAVIVLTALLGLLAFAPPLRSWRSRHFATLALTLTVFLVFSLLLVESFQFATSLESRLERLDSNAPR
jgi:hypothetical protein